MTAIKRWLMPWTRGGWIWELGRCDHARRCCGYCVKCDDCAGRNTP